jgi:Protein of unknown function (DUF3000)
VTQVPAEFERAVACLRAPSGRPEVFFEPVPPPSRLAPYTHAIGAEVAGADDEIIATGRLVLLCDPDGSDAWGGTLRLVTFASAELDPEMARDPMLAEVGWSWLTEALEAHRARFSAAGGTVTETSSARFGDIAGPAHTLEIELRASWTPADADLTPHLRAWTDLLCTAAGLPPPGVISLTARAAAGDDQQRS